MLFSRGTKKTSVLRELCEAHGLLVPLRFLRSESVPRVITSTLCFYIFFFCISLPLPAYNVSRIGEVFYEYHLQ